MNSPLCTRPQFLWPRLRPPSLASPCGQNECRSSAAVVGVCNCSSNWVNYLLWLYFAINHLLVERTELFLLHPVLFTIRIFIFMEIFSIDLINCHCLSHPSRILHIALHWQDPNSTTWLIMYFNILLFTLIYNTNATKGISRISKR